MKYAYLTLGIICFLVAFNFGKDSTTEVFMAWGESFLEHSAKSQNITAAGASAGFAIAGGICILASAIQKNEKA